MIFSKQKEEEVIIRKVQGPKEELENDNKNGSKEIVDRSQKIVTEFKNTTNDLSGVYGLFVVDFKSGYSFGISEDESFTAASLIKLPVMAAAYLESEKGSLNLETIYTLKDSDKIGGSGSLYYKPAGKKLSYKDLLMLMGKQSDTTAFGIMKKIVGDTKINEVIKTIGMSSKSLTDNSTRLL